MKSPSETLLETSTRLVYSMDRVSPVLKVFWNRFLLFYFSDKLIDTQIRQRHIAAASRRFSSMDEAKRLFDILENDISEPLVKLLMILKEQALKNEDWRAAKDVEATIDTLTNGDHTLEARYHNEIKELLIRFHSFEHPKTFNVPGALKLIAADYFFRWLIIVIGNNFSLSPDALFALNVIPTVTIIFVAWLTSRKCTQLNTELVKRHLTGPFRLQTRYSTWQYTVVAFYFISGIFITVLLKGEGDPGLVLLSLLILLVHYYFLLVVFPTGKLSEASLLAELHEVHVQEQLDADENDEAIVRLETQLSSQTGRLEAYVLESALFGALAFSGFLQIIATDLISFTDLENFADSFFKVSRAFVVADWNVYHSHAAMLSTKESLFCLVSIETLLCSGLFLAVIASRLRFSDVADNVRTSLNLAKAYNDKEEFVQESLPEGSSSARLETLNRKVNVHIADAWRSLRGINPIVAYMVYFRNSGIITFLLVLISSSLFISGYLGWTFVLFALATLFYFNLGFIRKAAAQSSLSFQVFFMNYSWRLFAFALSPALLGFLLHTTIGLPGTNLLIALTFILVTIFFYTWIVFMPHHDERFGDIENLKGEIWRSSRYKLVKNIFGIAIIFSGVGLAFKFLATSGADELMILGLTVLSLTSYAVGFFLSRPKWLGILCGVVLGNSAFGILFKFLHLPGGNELMIIALGFQSVFYLLYLFGRHRFHRIFFRVAAAFSIATLLVLDFGGAGVYTRLNLMYAHQTLHIGQLAQTYISIPINSASEEQSEKELKMQISRCDEYLSQYPLLQMTIVHRRFGYYFYDVITESLYARDSVAVKPESLAKAEKAFHELKKIEQRYDYMFGGNITLEADLLLAQGKIDEAIKNLNDLLATAPVDFHTRLKAKLGAIQAKGR